MEVLHQVDSLTPFGVVPHGTPLSLNCGFSAVRLGRDLFHLDLLIEGGCICLDMSVILIFMTSRDQTSSRNPRVYIVCGDNRLKYSALQVRLRYDILEAKELDDSNTYFTCYSSAILYMHRES